MTYPLPGPDSPPPPSPPGPSSPARVLRIVGLVADLAPYVLVTVAGCSLIGFAVGGALWH